MANIQKYSDRLPSLNGIDLGTLLIQDLPQDFDSIELVISLKKDKLNVKDFSSYLNFIYRIDGHLSDEGLLSYSHYPNNQLEISEIRIGSYEIIFEWLRNNLQSYNTIIVLFLALKYLSKVIQSYLDVAYKGYQILDIREDVLEKNQKRKSKDLKEQIEKKEKRAYKKELRILLDNELPNLDKKQKEKLVETIAQLYLKVGYRNISAARFSEQLMTNIKLLPKKK